MGIDGFSMGNLGLNASLTSAQMATQSEMIALKESEIKIKDVSSTAEDENVKRKEKELQETFEDGSKKKKKDESEDSEGDDEKNQNVLNRLDFGGENAKEFSLRLNPETNTVELYNKKEKKIIETISTEDLMYLVSKLDSASGVLVNRKI